MTKKQATRLVYDYGRASFDLAAATIMDSDKPIKITGIANRVDRLKKEIIKSLSEKK